MTLTKTKKLGLKEYATFLVGGILGAAIVNLLFFVIGLRSDYYTYGSSLYASILGGLFACMYFYHKGYFHRSKK